MIVLTPVAGEAGTASWPSSVSFVTSFEPMSPVPPMMTIFMIHLSLVQDGRGNLVSLPDQWVSRAVRRTWIACSTAAVAARDGRTGLSIMKS